MTDTRPQNHTHEFPDDDRLLAYVLGLDDDPELEAAAAGDEALRRRLELLRDEMNEVGNQVRHAVPHPDADYAEIGDQRWKRLQAVIDAAAAPEARFARRRTVAWLRLLAPAAAIVLVAVVGVVTLQRETDMTAENTQAPEAITAPRTDGKAEVSVTLPNRPSPGQFFAVVVARAHDVEDGFQQFEVLRVLQGSAPETLRLRFEAEPARVGRLHVLYLAASYGQTAAAGPDSLAGSNPGAGAVPSVSPELQGDETRDPGTVLGDDELRFVDQGSAVVAVALPEGVEPDQVALP